MLLTWQKFQHHTHTYIHLFASTYIYMYLHTYIHFCTCKHIFMHVCARFYTHIFSLHQIFLLKFLTLVVCVVADVALAAYCSFTVSVLFIFQLIWQKFQKIVHFDESSVIHFCHPPCQSPIANRQSPVTSTTVVAAQVLPKYPNHNHTSQFPIRQLQQKQPNSCAAPQRPAYILTCMQYIHMYILSAIQSLAKSHIANIAFHRYLPI